jgi:hypothetical protein
MAQSFNPFMMIDAYKFTQGNPGCCTIFQYAWDLGDLEMNQLKMWCEMKKLYGSDVWVAFKELAHKDYSKFMEIIRQDLQSNPDTKWIVR